MDVVFILAIITAGLGLIGAAVPLIRVLPRRLGLLFMYGASVMATMIACVYLLEGNADLLLAMLAGLVWILSMASTFTYSIERSHRVAS